MAHNMLFNFLDPSKLQAGGQAVETARLCVVEAEAAGVKLQLVRLVGCYGC